MTTRTVSYSRADARPDLEPPSRQGRNGRERRPSARDGRARDRRQAGVRLPPGSAGVGARQGRRVGRHAGRHGTHASSRGSARSPCRPRSGSCVGSAGKGNAILLANEVKIREEKQVTLNTNPFCEEQAARLGLDAKTARWWEKERRVCHIAKIEWPNRQRMLIANLHATKADDLRMANAEVRRAMSFVDRQAEIEETIVVAGDFNVAARRVGRPARPDVARRRALLARRSGRVAHPRPGPPRAPHAAVAAALVAERAAHASAASSSPTTTRSSSTCPSRHRRNRQRRRPSRSRACRASPRRSARRRSRRPSRSLRRRRSSRSPSSSHSPSRSRQHRWSRSRHRSSRRPLLSSRLRRPSTRSLRRSSRGPSRRYASAAVRSPSSGPIGWSAATTFAMCSSSSSPSSSAPA